MLLDLTISLYSNHLISFYNKLIIELSFVLEDIYAFTC